MRLLFIFLINFHSWVYLLWNLIWQGCLHCVARVCISRILNTNNEGQAVASRSLAPASSGSGANWGKKRLNRTLCLDDDRIIIINCWWIARDGWWSSEVILLTNNRPTLDQLLTNLWPTFDHPLTSFWPTFGQLLTNILPELINFWPTFEQLLNNPWPTFDQFLTNFWLTLLQLSWITKAGLKSYRLTRVI